MTRSVTVPVSAGLLADTTGYFGSLDAYRLGDLDPIVVRASDAAFAAVHNARQLREEVNEAENLWNQRMSGVRSDSIAWRVVSDLVNTPIVDAAGVSQRHSVSVPTANEAIARLVERGILVRANGGLRFRKWIALDVAAALDRFADRSQRRSF